MVRNGVAQAWFSFGIVQKFSFTLMQSYCIRLAWEMQEIFELLFYCFSGRSVADGQPDGDDAAAALGVADVQRPLWRVTISSQTARPMPEPLALELPL
jgi:hypothetical protein